MTNHAPHKRRIRLIRPDIQLRLIGAFAGLTALAMMAQILVLGAAMTRFAERLPSGGVHVAEALPGLLLKCLAVSAVLIVPALLIIGIRVTFHLAGPIYKMERYLDSVAKGESTGPCFIRKTDHLQGFCEKLNAALAAARDEGATRKSGVDEETRAAA